MEQQPSLLKEIRTHGTSSFPCAIYRTYFKGKGRPIKYHWQNEAEILYFSGGKFRLEINMEAFQVEHPAFAPVRNAFVDIMRSFGQMAQDDTLAADSSMVTNDLTSQLYIKSSLQTFRYDTLTIQKTISKVKIQ